MSDEAQDTREELTAKQRWRNTLNLFGDKGDFIALGAFLLFLLTLIFLPGVAKVVCAVIFFGAIMYFGILGREF